MKKLNGLLIFLLGSFLGLKSMENPCQKEKSSKTEEKTLFDIPSDAFNIIMSFTTNVPKKPTEKDLIVAIEKFLEFKNINKAMWDRISTSESLNKIMINKFREKFPSIDGLNYIVDTPNNLHKILFALLLGTKGACKSIESFYTIKQEQVRWTLFMIQNVTTSPRFPVSNRTKDDSNYMQNIKALVARSIKSATHWFDPNEDVRERYLFAMIQAFEEYPELKADRDSYLLKLNPENRKKYHQIIFELNNRNIRSTADLDA